MIVEKTKLSDLLFIDIETVPAFESYDLLDDEWKSLWDYKASFLARNGESSEELYARAGIYAEFGKVVCVSCGFFHEEDKAIQFRIKTFFGENEHQLLSSLANMLKKHFNKPAHKLVAHNGKEFDFPYLARRLLISGVNLPNILNLGGKKPWEIQHIDTLELWKFGDYKHYTSLRLLAKVFDLPSPKDDIDGSQVAHVFYIEKNLPRLVQYCENDVLTLANLYLRMNGKPIIEASAIVKNGK